MPVRKGLFKLYEAKALVMEAIRDAVITESPETNLWVSVLEQAIFDAHLHSTGGKYPSVFYVKDARDWIGGPEFRRVCESLNLEAEWVRSMVDKIGALSRDLRGREYELAAIPTPTRKRPTRRAHAGRWRFTRRLIA